MIDNNYDNKTDIFAAALDYADKGFHVLPLKPHSKEPATKNGFYDATTDLEQILKWYKENRNYNIGIRVGPETGLAVIDDDDGGEFFGICAEAMNTVRVKTRRGYHFWFRYPESGTVPNGDRGRFEVKSKGYVVAPPSIHPSGGVYEWDDDASPDDSELAECPEFLVELSRPTVPIHSGRDDSLENLEVVRFKDMEKPSGERPYIVKNLVYRGFPAALYGEGGTVKSYLAMHMAQCIVRGDPWLGFSTEETPVLLVDFELDAEEQARRAYQVATGDGLSEPPEDFYYITAAGHSTREVFDYVLEVSRTLEVGMVIVDSLGYAIEGESEASKVVLEFFRKSEARLRAAGISLFCIDHQAKAQPGGRYEDKSMFGSVYKTNTIRSILQVEASGREENTVNLIARHKKTNFGPLINPFGIRVIFDKGLVMVAEREIDDSELSGNKAPTTKELVKDALKDGPLFPEQIAFKTGRELKTVKNALTELRKSGEVEPTGKKSAGKGGSEEVRLTELSSRPNPLWDAGRDGSEPDPVTVGYDHSPEAVKRAALGEMDDDVPFE